MKKIALALFPFMEDLNTDLEGTLKQIKQLGYDGVEFAFGLQYEPKRLRNALEEAGLSLVGWHIDKSYINNEFFEAVVHYMLTVENHRLVIPWIPDSATESKEAWEKTAEEFNYLAEKLSERGILLGYHNHQKEFKRVDSEYLFDTFCKKTTDKVFLQLDIGNMLSAGASPEAFLRKYPGRFNTIHIKPYSLENGFCTMIGEDSIDYDEVIKISEQNGTEWFIVEYELSSLYGRYEGAQKCLENLKGYIL